MVTKVSTAEELDLMVEDVIRSGESIEFERHGVRLQIVPVAPPSKLSRLVPRPGLVVGDSEDFVHMDWSSFINADLP